MGNFCLSTNVDLEKNYFYNSRVVDKELSKQRLDDQVVKKILLLGSGNSGKSTIFKQLKQIHGQFFNEKDIQDGIATIHDCILGQIKALVFKCREISEKTGNSQYALTNELNEAAKCIEDFPCDSIINNEIAQCINMLWKSDPIILTFTERSSLEIADTCPHFLDDIWRIGNENYRPTEQDLLLVRSPTTGVIEVEFEMQKYKYKIYDVGGQKNERRKWIHCFEGITAILFVASLNDYDQVLYEDENTNAMYESLNLFEEICNSRWFRRTSIILFLNKSDLFKKKINRVSLTICFLNYVCDSTKSKYDHGISFIREKYNEKNRNPDQKKIYTHITCGIDRNNITHAFNDVRHIVINQSLERSGII